MKNAASTVLLKTLSKMDDRRLGAHANGAASGIMAAVVDGENY